MAVFCLNLHFTQRKSAIKCRYLNAVSDKVIDRELVTSAKKIHEFSEIKKIRKKFVKCPSGRGLPTTTEEFDAFHDFMLIKI